MLFFEALVVNNKNNKVAILGGGSFGTALANMIAVNGYQATLWLRSEEVFRQVTEDGENSAYLPGYKLHPSLSVSTDLKASVEGCDSVFFAIPSGSFRDVAKQVSPWISSGSYVVSTAKGI